jgi:hypothetical protein
MLSTDKIVIKLTTPWKHPFFYSHTPNGTGIIGDYKFEIDNDIKECDFWIVWGGLNPTVEFDKVKCPAENVIFLTDEVHVDRRFYQGFLDQFPTVVTPRKDIEHQNVIFWHELNTWHLNKSFDELISLDRLEKTKTLSVISSNLFALEGHRKRFEFINRLIGHFKDKLDAYGRGIKPFNDKFETLAPYKYCLAIENSFVPGYFTEKISECFLGLTVPLYYGCPDISSYFNPESFYNIDIYDYKRSILEIERIIEEDEYEKKLPYLIEAKNTYLTKYDVFHGIVKLIEQKFELQSAKKNIKIYREARFEKFYRLKRIIQLYNNRSFIPKSLKFDVTFYEKGKFSGKY